MCDLHSSVAPQLIPGLSFPLTWRSVNILGVRGLKLNLYCFEMKLAVDLDPDTL